MSQPNPAHQAGNNIADGGSKTESTTRAWRDRHGRRERAAPTTTATGPSTTTGPRKTTGPRWTVAPPKVVPMDAEQHQQAIQAWAALIAAWWTDNPPEHEPQDDDQNEI